MAVSVAVFTAEGLTGIGIDTIGKLRAAAQVAKKAQTTEIRSPKLKIWDSGKIPDTGIV